MRKPKIMVSNIKVEYSKTIYSYSKNTVSQSIHRDLLLVYEEFVIGVTFRSFFYRP